MAEEQSNTNHQVQDRGLFDFMGKKENVEEDKPQEAAIVATDMENLKVSQPEEEEAEKKPSLLEKLHRSDSSSSSSSSSEEEVEEGGEKIKRKKKKGLKEKISGDDTSIPIEKVQVSHPEEKKTFMEKIKEKLPGKKPEETAPVVAVEAAQPKEEKKGIFDKIKEKIPGYHKTEADKKETTADH